MAKLRYRTLRENVVDEIRMKILNREYEPGMRIVEQNLSDELGVSRGPIREALRQLMFMKSICFVQLMSRLQFEHMRDSFPMKILHRWNPSWKR